MMTSEEAKMQIELFKELEYYKSHFEGIQEENKVLKKQVLELEAELARRNNDHGFIYGRGKFHASYKQNVTAEYLLKYIHDTRIVNLNKIGAHFGVSYATVRRRLQADQLFPIDLKKIDKTYQAYDDVGLGYWCD